MNWSNGFGQYSQRNELQRTHSHNNDNNTSTANEEYVDEDEEDPFGDFAASTDEPDQWEDAFSAGFSDTKNDAANNEQPDQFEDAFSTSASNTKTNHVEKDEFQDVFSSNFSDSKVEPVENGAVNSEQKDQTSQADTISPSSLDDKIDTVKHEHKEEQSKDVGFSTSKETDTESKPDQFEDAFSSNFTKVNPNMSEPSGGFSSNFSDMKIDTTKENTIKNENKDQSPPVCS